MTNAKERRRQAMLCISIRQPWADLILEHGKDIENRTWPTNVRGRVLVHASKGMTHDEYLDARQFAWYECERLLPETPPPSMCRGGIIGSVEIVDCVTESASPWFCGPYGFVLRNPEMLPFEPWRGRLGFFDVVTFPPLPKITYTKS